MSVRVKRAPAQQISGLIGRDLEYAVNIIETVCWLAGTPNYLDDLRATFRKERFLEPSRRQTSAALFDWLAASMSYQGISDEVAREYMIGHGRPSWTIIADDLASSPSCPKLESYWHFHGCQYRKATGSCAEPELFNQCPLPRHDFRNGNLNQLAYSLFLFIRDIADGDLVGWIDAQIGQADEPGASDRVDRMAEAVLNPLRGIHGVSDKVLNMVLSDFLLVAGRHDDRWAEVGGSMIAIDTLVHNFLHRTGILKRARAEHPYGPQCYNETGCAAILKAISSTIDARTFNPRFPKNFPRYVQKSIWGFCSQEGFDVCNGRNIKDSQRCLFRECRIYHSCDRIRLHDA
jgi:hypothetical protein